MKSKFFISLPIMLIGMIAVVISCSDLQEDELVNTDHLRLIKSDGGILEEETLLGDNIYLPKGTYWYYSNKEKNEVIFELPEKYTFLLEDLDTGKFRISTEGGGYSCTCSGGGSCTTFYNQSLGYGCLQSDCTGSCTGKPNVITKNERIVGVLNSENSMMDADLNQEKASLSEQGIKGLFEVKEILFNPLFCNSEISQKTFAKRNIYIFVPLKMFLQIGNGFG